MSREIRSYDYVNHPYAAVRDALVKNPAGVLRAATNAAASRARAVAAALHVNIGPLDIGAEIAVTVGNISEQTHDAPVSRVTRIPMEWSAAQRAGLFPMMNAELSVYPLTATETQLDFLGRYEPPLGIVGGALDAMVGHRIAEAAVHRLVADVASYLREHVKQFRRRARNPLLYFTSPFKQVLLGQVFLFFGTPYTPLVPAFAPGPP